MKKAVLILLIVLVAVSFIAACAPKQQNYVTGQAYNPYNAPPGAAGQGQNPPPQPLVAGGGCGV